jgi:hypothetical protein
VGRGKRNHVACEGERYEELCGQCWKGRLCVSSSGEVFPCVFSRLTGLGDVRSGLENILKTTKLAEFRRKARTIQRSRRATPASAIPRVLNAPNRPSEAGADGSSTGCSPAGCSPAGCSPAGCSPAGCSPSGCSPTGRGHGEHERDAFPGSTAGGRRGGIYAAAGALTLTESTARTSSSVTESGVVA